MSDGHHAVLYSTGRLDIGYFADEWEMEAAVKHALPSFKEKKKALAKKMRSHGMKEAQVLVFADDDDRACDIVECVDCDNADAVVGGVCHEDMTLCQSCLKTKRAWYRLWGNYYCGKCMIDRFKMWASP